MELEHTIRKAVIDTTAMLRQNPQDHGTIEWKHPGDPVTSWDKRVERIIRAELEGYDAKIIGEEYGTTGAVSADGRSEHTPRYTVYIDPIDGTKSFIRGKQGCSVSVALEEHGKLIAGAVGDITSGLVYYADRNERETIDTLTGRILPARKSNPLPRPSIGINENAVHLYDALDKEDLSVTVGGAAGALLMALVAAGVYDGMVFAPRNNGGPSAYDIAAGCYLMERAGMRITDFAGKPYSHTNPKQGIIAAPRELHERLLAKARQAA